MSAKQDFFNADRFALVGGGKGRKFPELTQRYLGEAGKSVFPVDLSEAEGEQVDSLLASIPPDTERVIVEVPKEQTTQVVQNLVERGFGNLWLHQMTETEEAVDYCAERGAEVQTGSCAVMYLAPTMSPHALHRGVWKLIGRY